MIGEPRALEHRDATVAREIERVLHAAYAVEAEILDVSDFAPLSRAATDVARSASRFHGLFEEDELVAVLELEPGGEHQLRVASLAVHPNRHRRGLASRLLAFAIAEAGRRHLRVCTARRNAPALELYRRHGFVETEAWSTTCGLAMVTLERNAD